MRYVTMCDVTMRDVTLHYFALPFTLFALHYTVLYPDWFNPFCGEWFLYTDSWIDTDISFGMCDSFPLIFLYIRCGANVTISSFFNRTATDWSGNYYIHTVPCRAVLHDLFIYMICWTATRDVVRDCAIITGSKKWSPNSPPPVLNLK